MKKYDYLVVGAGLFGAVFANRAHKAGKKVLVLEKRNNIGGNVFTGCVEGIHVHEYGAHIFHTDDENVWNFVNSFAAFNNYVHSVKANYKEEIYSLPFNMHTFKELWDVDDPEEAKLIIEEQKAAANGSLAESHIDNLEDMAISLVGTDVYEKLVKGYTEKQWGRKCCQLPAFIIKRLPLRFEYDNNYFNSKYQGIPVCGYTKMVENMLEGIEVILNADFNDHRQKYLDMAEKIVFTGPVDEFFDYRLGRLEYRTVDFETELLDKPDYQGCSVINYTDVETPWTRIIEHKWFTFGRDENGNELEKTVISKEYSREFKSGMKTDPYYPVNDEKNCRLYEKYRKLADEIPNVIFGGRLGEYKYYDMDKVILSALELSEKELGVSEKNQMIRNRV